MDPTQKSTDVWKLSRTRSPGSIRKDLRTGYLWHYIIYNKILGFKTPLYNTSLPIDYVYITYFFSDFRIVKISLKLSSVEVNNKSYSSI